MLVGVSEADRRRSKLPLQENELRLMTEARAALEERLHADELSRGLAAGEALSEAELVRLINESLARAVADCR